MNSIIIIAVCVIIICATGIFLYLQNNITDITEYNLKYDGATQRVKIVQLSDLHSKPFKKVLKKLDEIKPDIICITGDYINDKEKNKSKMLEYGKELVKRAKVFYITGNHERRLDDFDELMQELRNIGFIVLLNRAVTYDDKVFEINILGLDENQASFDDYKARRNGTFEYKDMSPYFSELEKMRGYKIVLSHFPENFEGVEQMNYSQYDFDLQLSGHAHGGQFCLPFIGPIFSPG